MRWSSWSSFALALAVGLSLSAPVEDIARSNVDTITAAEKRAVAESTALTADIRPTQAPVASSTIVSVSSTTDAVTETPATTAAETFANLTNSTTSRTDHSAAVATSIPSLEGSTPSNSGGQTATKPAFAGGLPIQPQITPAWGVGGILLLLLGAAQAFIGIRKKLTHIFLPTSFSAALGVTVLIVYVMNPPVSNAVQGGYLVAVFFTGAVFGGLALIFKEITEGLGCLLGGFCIGMWLLTVKSGGLLTDGGQITGFLVAFTVGFWSLSFSHYTRFHGSMVCTAFSGATAIALGIDCYSRAGLKEFWAYIWGLNMDMFPLNTDTYPVTRSIRVELAITVIVTVFGVIAQLRLWKVIKARRTKEATSRKEAEIKSAETDAEVGRQLEEKNLQERAEWENTYAGDSAHKAPSMTETELMRHSETILDERMSSKVGGENGNVVEMKEFPHSQQDKVSRIDQETGSEIAEGHERKALGANGQGIIATSLSNDGRPASSPAVVYSAPNLHRDDSSEHGAVVGSEPGTPRSRHRSGISLMKRLSVRSARNVAPSVNIKAESQSREALITQDDSSSLCAIADDVSSIGEIQTDELIAEEKRQEPLKELKNEAAPKVILGEATNSDINTQAYRADPASSREMAVEPADTSAVQPAQSGMNFQIHEDGDSDDKENSQVDRAQQENQVAKPENIVLTIQSSSKAEPAVSPQSQGQPEETSGPEQDENLAPLEATKEVPKSSDPEQEFKSGTLKKTESVRLDASTIKAIPEQTSSIVNSFRTNEWAKHLADAETPEIPEIETMRSDQDEPEQSTEVTEIPAPVNVEGLLQTPLNAVPAPLRSSFRPETSLDLSHLPPHGISGLRSSGASKLKARDSVGSANGARSSLSMSRNLSSPSISPLQEALDQFASPQNSSTPFLPKNHSSSTLAASTSPRWSGPPPLLAVRENMVKNRVSSTSLRYDPYGSRNQSRLSVVDPSLIASTPLSIPEENVDQNHIDPAEDADEIPLSKRRAVLQRQTQRSASATSPKITEPEKSSRQPSVESGRPAAVMAAWRQSVRDDLSQRRDSYSIPSSPPTPAYPERPRASWGSGQQSQEKLAEQIDKTIADRMQRGSMTDLHRQAMRRMQASANRKL
ncbi:hypothetical protein PDE_09568 [Penicillium oxalicum 114-2]|uniref:TM7S3/TM198-like domain-containing protein n=1 Tax=Penicillium oxalicum (strain 114-2 / CGMCC 5302) TaxID=933388 RepID=S7ZVY6_PENO1|nr:hypothetical protein PDE_09568 [Penicillium oxalicum 114-2]